MYITSFEGRATLDLATQTPTLLLAHLHRLREVSLCGKVQALLLGPNLDELQPSPQTESTRSSAVPCIFHELVHQFGIQEADKLREELDYQAHVDVVLAESGERGGQDKHHITDGSPCAL